MLEFLKRLHVIHSWTPWKDGDKYDVTEGVYHNGIRYVTNTSHVLHQESRCEVCNALRARRVKL